MASDYLYVISNGSTDVYQNTLRNFRNNVFFSNNRAIEEIALSEIYVDDRFTNPFLPKNPDCPSIICTKTRPDDISDSIINELKSGEKIFLPHVHYNLNGLLDSITKCRGFKEVSNSSSQNIAVEDENVFLWFQNVVEQKIFFGRYL